MISMLMIVRLIASQASSRSIGWMSETVLLGRMKNLRLTGMRRLLVAALGLVLLSTIGNGQDQKTANSPFALTWSEGRCIGCKTATQLGKVQFISRKDVWAIGASGAHAAGPTIVVHSTDAGRTWRERPQTLQYPGAPDGPPAFSFLDPMRGWIAWWNSTEDAPEMIGNPGRRRALAKPVSAILATDADG